MTGDSISTRIEKLHDQAAAFAGYENFGGNDDNYLEGLRAYLETAENEANLTDLGKAVVDQIVLGNLIGRLYAERGLEQYPECLSQPIVKPIIVVGLPRSGTTALHKLLASVPRTQSLEYWLAMFPMPRPPKETWQSLEQYRQVDLGLTEMMKSAPDMLKIHPYGADIPDECNRIICHSFQSWALKAIPHTQTFGKWVLKRDLSKAYERCKKVLQLIGYRNPARWVLKDPLHPPFIDLLLAQYPDACIVHIYREPSESIPSVCNGIYTFAAPYQQNVDKREYGQDTAEEYALMMDRFMELRSKLDPTRFLDVSYTDMITDPVSLAKRIYRHFDIDIGIDGAQSLEKWHQGNKRDKFGKHHYTAEQYGLSREMLNERFTKFRKQYLLAH